MFYRYSDNYCLIKINQEVNADKLFSAFLPSKKEINNLYNNPLVTINNQIINRNSLLKGELKLPLNYEYCPQADQRIKILYEDAIAIIVYKDKNLLVHDDGNNSVNLKEKLSTQLGYLVEPVCRLDKDTDGLILFSKTKIFKPYFDSAIAENGIRRIYQAIVKAKVLKDRQFKFSEAIGRDRHNSRKMHISKNGKQALTLVKCLKNKNDYSLLECELKSGRTHQIRLHLAYHDMPIVNDELYGIKDKYFKTMGLSCTELIFKHPLSQEEVRIGVDLREEFKNYFS